MPYATTLTDVTTKQKKDAKDTMPTQPLANEGFVPNGGGQEQRPGGTLHYGSVDPATGKRFERFVRDSSGNAVTKNVTETGTPKVGRYTDAAVSATALAKTGEPDASSNVDTFYEDLATKEDLTREDMRSQAQKAINSINEIFTNRFSREKESAKGRSGQTRAVSSRGGVLGSTMGDQRQAGTDKFNTQEVERIEAEKQAEITSAITGFENLARQQISLDRETAFAERGEVLEKRKELTLQGLQMIGDLASTGQSWDTLEKDTKQQMVDTTGMSPLASRLRYNAQLPMASQIDLQFEKLDDGNYMFWGLDPQTGQLVQERFEYDVPGDSKLQILDGNPYFIRKDADGNQYLEPAEGYMQDELSQYERQLGIAEKEQGLEKGEIGLQKGIQDIQKGDLDIKTGERDLAERESMFGLDVQEKQLKIEQMYKDLTEEPDPAEKEKKMLEIQKLRDGINKGQAEIDKDRMRAGDTVDVLQGQIDMVDDLLNNSSASIENLVGTNILGRMPMASRWSEGNRKVVGAVGQLISQETLNTLVGLKERGGTLGAISEKELDILQSAATQLNKWEDKNDKGIGKGTWNTSSNLFKKELIKIKESKKRLMDAAQRDAEEGLTAPENSFDDAGDVITGDEELDGLYNNQ